MTDSIEEPTVSSPPESSIKNRQQQTIAITVPYMFAYGTISKALERIQSASTPERFTIDFLSTKLNMKGGTPRPVIPFLKKTGFLNSDGTPTDIYKEFRNPSLRSKAAARAVKKGYAPLYEINEYVHDLNDKELEGVIVQLTGLNSTSKTVKGIAGSFKALKNFAKFDDESLEENTPEEIGISNPEKKVGTDQNGGGTKLPVGLKLGYVINLNLPATSDIAVFDAIFKSLRKHILE